MGRGAMAWTRLAGVLLIADGFIIAILGVVLVAVLTPVGAIQGRDPVDQTPYPLLIVPLVLALACLWVGHRAIRGIRKGRMVGIALALIPAVVFGAAMLNPGATTTELAFAAVVVGVQVVIVIALARWPEGEVAGA